MNRLLTKRDKNGGHRRSKSSDRGNSKPLPISGNGILSLFKPSDKKQEKEDAKKIQAIKSLLREHNIMGIDDPHIVYSLQTKYADGDVDKALEMLVLIQESVEGIVRPYNPSVQMLGAENRENVTCYLDALLFAMFARLESFESMLHRTFEDEPRRRLSSLIRLWVNMLRTGKLIQTDITQHLQEALAACGWEDSAEPRQQDTSEAFGFITEKLQLPLLTLEMDIFHEGKGEAADDHKLINERLLEVAVPDLTEEGKTIRLEDCLEDYFNTRVEVVRRLERRDTLRRATTDTSTALYAVDEKSPLTKHIEAAEDVDTSSMTPTMSELSDGSAPLSPSVSTPLHRHPSIIRHITVTEIEAGESSASGDAASVKSSTRKGSLRKEVLIPAWQFFRIIRLSPICFHIAPSIINSKPESIVLIGNTAWYTAQIPVDDAQVAEHFSSTRPVLGICLKRYAMSSQGQPIRLSTAIDIPLQIALPHFIQDDKATEGGPSFGNFNLLLQSVICHRGTSVHSGHYISFIRGTPRTKSEEGIAPRRPSADSQLPEYSEDRWIKFDDLASERVTYVDIEKAMAEEMPYLLFYQVQPLVPETPALTEHENRPPSYEDSGVTMALYPASPVRAKTSDLELISSPTYFDDAFSANEEHLKGRSSFSTDNDLPRKSLSIQEFNFSRRGSLATETSTTVPITGEDSPAQTTRPSRAASRFGRRGGNDGKSKSRPSSHVDEHRISATFSRLGILSNKSKEPLNRLQDISPSDILPLSTTAAEGQTKLNIEVPTSNGTGKAKDNDAHLPYDPQHAYAQIYTPHKAKKSKDQERECVVM